MSMKTYITSSGASPKSTPQTQPILGREQDMTQNAAGGYSFAIDRWSRLTRFLILGSEGGTYYSKEQKLTQQNATNLVACIKADALRVVNEIVAVSDAGRAPKNTPALFALGLVASMGDEAGKRAALAALPKVARIGTHLFDFVSAVDAMRGWGKTLREGVANWYTDRSPHSLASQAAKYQSRNGWSHKDVLRLCHATSDNPGHQAVFRWIVAGMDGMGERTVKRGEKSMTYPDLSAHVPRLLQGFELAKRSPDAATTARLVTEYQLPRECVLTQHLNSPVVWEALLPHMGPEAMIRNLGKMTSIGLVAPMSAASKLVADKLADIEALREKRTHPMQILIGLRQYAMGHGDKGNLHWSPVSTVVDALDAAFYLAFPLAVPAGKRTLVAVDVSGSMTGGSCGGLPITPREAAAVFALLTARLEPQYHILGFTHKLVDLGITARDSLSAACNKASRVDFGATDCALPMATALANSWDVDTFYVLTDNETWAGRTGHPAQVLQQYRQRRGTPAKLVVAGFTATNCSIADPNDGGMLDVVGLDAATPQLVADFSAGRA
jgi:60 kDa SS-A/Ro ribonucleoprotein